MQTYSWNPWSIFDELERFGRRSPEGPAFDIEDDDDATTLTADVPGMTDADIEITVAGPLLTVRGERGSVAGRYVRRDRWYGAFERQFRLGDQYDPDAITANVHAGVLTIRIGKVAKARPRRIKLTTGLVDKVKGLLSGDKAA